MKPIELSLIPHKTTSGLAYQHVSIRIATSDGIIEPKDLVGLKLPENIDFSQGIVLEGKAPIWLYAYLVHESHAAGWVGCYDPRHKGAVVVETHTHSVSVGQVLELELPA